MWMTLALISALFLGVYDICKKASLRNNAVLPVLVLATFFSALPFAILTALSVRMGANELGILYVETASASTHAMLFIKALIVASSWVCAYFALKHLPLSIGSPIRASQPLATLVGAILIFGETLTPMRWAGVATALASYLLLSMAGRREGIDFTRNGWILLMVLGTLLGAVSSLYDKHLLRQLQPMVVQSYYSMYMVIVLGVALLSIWWPRRQTLTPFTWRWTIPAIGLCLAVADFCYFQALATPDSRIALITVVRRSNVVVSFGLGALLFHELNLRSKALALLGIVAGIILIGLG